MTALEHFRSKVASSLDMGDAGRFVVLTLEEAQSILAEIDAPVVYTLKPGAIDIEEVRAAFADGPGGRLVVVPNIDGPADR